MIPLAELLAKRRPMDPHLLRNAPRRRNPWSLSLLTILVTATSFVVLLSIIHSFLNRQVEPPGGCRGPYMRPAYIKFTGFDTEHTRFASKYSLYLYREDGLDDYSEANIGVSETLLYWNTVLIEPSFMVRQSSFSPGMLGATNKYDPMQRKLHNTFMM